MLSLLISNSCHSRATKHLENLSVDFLSRAEPGLLSKKTLFCTKHGPKSVQVLFCRIHYRKQSIFSIIFQTCSNGIIIDLVSLLLAVQISFSMYPVSTTYQYRFLCMKVHPESPFLPHLESWLGEDYLVLHPWDNLLQTRSILLWCNGSFFPDTSYSQLIYIWGSVQSS